MNQWVDLGSHKEACMTQPWTCGVAGGAISFWANIIDCPMDRKGGGVMTAMQRGTTHGFQIRCTGNNIRYKFVSRVCKVGNHYFASHSYVAKGFAFLQIPVQFPHTLSILTWLPRVPLKPWSDKYFLYLS